MSRKIEDIQATDFDTMIHIGTYNNEYHTDVLYYLKENMYLRLIKSNKYQSSRVTGAFFYEVDKDKKVSIFSGDYIVGYYRPTIYHNITDKLLAELPAVPYQREEYNNIVVDDIIGLHYMGINYDINK